MKSNLLAVGFIILFLTGCQFGYHCTYRHSPLNHMRSMCDYWFHPQKKKRDKTDYINIPSKLSLKDWYLCGGGGIVNGWYQTPVLWSESTTTEEIIAASRQKVEEIERCMLDKGYRYVGPCDSEITRNSVACREGR